jgi:hypothetical protein
MFNNRIMYPPVTPGKDEYRILYDVLESSNNIH